MKQKAVVVISGGMDSATLLFKVVDDGYEAHCISFDYGQKHKKEVQYAKRLCEYLQVPHEIVDISGITKLISNSALTNPNIEIPEGHYEDENMKATVVPNRNMIMLAIATGYAVNLKAQVVFFGPHGGDHVIYPDCRPEFVEAMSRATAICDWNSVRIEAPFLSMTKGDIAVLGKRFKVPYEMTWSCYKGRKKACGKCGTCVERLEAFKSAGMEDPIEYEKE